MSSRKEIDVRGLLAKIDGNNEFLLLDVREPYEHEEFNIDGRNLPLGNLMAEIEEVSDDKEKEIIVYCRSGNRSGMACDLLQAAGYSNVFNLKGGMIAWKEQNENV